MAPADHSDDDADAGRATRMDMQDIARMPLAVILAFLLELLLGACTHPTTEPREARVPRFCGGAMSSGAEVCACLIAHVRTTPAGEDRELTCREEPPFYSYLQTADFPLSVVQISGARQPLAYLVHTPATGERRVLAASPGRPGMKLHEVVTSPFPQQPGFKPGPAIEWGGGRRLVQVTTEWRGYPRGFKSLTLCVVTPPDDGRTSPDHPPSCPFTTLVERYLVTGSLPGGPDQSMPGGAQMEWERWAVAVDPRYGVALVVQVAGEPAPDVPTGAFRIEARR